MSFKVGCGDCGKEYEVDESKVGRRVKCRKCGNVFTIAKPEALEPAIAVGSDEWNLTESDAVEAEANSFPTGESDPFAAMAELEQNGVPIEEAPVQRNRWGASTRPLPLPPPMSAAIAPSPIVYAAAPRRSYGRAGRESGAIGTDSFTPLLIGGYLLGMVITGIVFTVQVMDLPEEVHSRAISLLWTTLGSTIVLFFILVAPLTLLGVFITSKILNFRLVDSAYLRACGVAALPSVIAMLTQLLPRNLVLIGLMVLAILPLFFYVLKFVFDLDWAGAGISFFFAGVFYVGGQVASIMLLSAIVIGGIFAQHKKTVANNANSPFSALAGGSDDSSPSPQIVQNSVDFEAERVTNLQKQVVQLSAERWDGVSREQALAQVASLKADAEALRSQHGSEPAWQQISDNLTALEQKAQLLPSEQPDDSVFQPLVASQEWTPDPLHQSVLSDEVSFKQFRFRPPAAATLDLRSSENDQMGLVWDFRNGAAGRISIASVPRRNPKQQRVWPVTQSFMLSRADSQNLFALSAEHCNVSFGNIGGIPFTRIEADLTSGRNPQRSVKYAGLSGDAFIVISISGSQEDAQASAMLESAARSLRPSRPEDPDAPAFSPKQVAGCLMYDGERAESLLRSMGPSAEDAVIAQLKNPNGQVVERAISVLKQIGSDKSLEPLRAVAISDNRQLAESAKGAIHQLSPGKSDLVADALLDLESNDVFRRRDALDSLAGMKPDQRRNLVCAKVMPLIVGKQQSFLDLNEVAKVLGVWGDDKIVTQLLPMIDPAGDANHRHAAMKIVGELKDKRGIIPIVRCLPHDSREVKEALIAMGPVAEDEVLKSLHSTDVTTRKTATEILGEIGTAKSLEPLAREAADKHDFFVRDTALRAVEAVRDRIRESHKKQGG